MSQFDEDYINDIFEQIASKFSVKDWTILKERFEAVAQNYFGVLIPVVFTGWLQEKQTSFYLVLKLAPTDERYRISGAISLAFEKEGYFYSTVMPKYQMLQQEVPTSSQFIAPNCYFTRTDNCKEVIVLENMCRIGYKPYANEMFLDLNHITTAIKSLAKLHALSFIHKKEDETSYKKTVDKCGPLNNRTNKRFIEILINRLDKAIQKFEKTEYQALLKNLKDNCITAIEATTFKVKETTLCHGDIWKENILFQYENGKPTNACIIDYQTVRISSPAYDVLYLIISSSNKELRKDNYENLIEAYYTAFDKFLAETGRKSDSVYSKGDFKHDLKIVAPACLIIANTALWLSSGLQEEGHVRSKKVLRNEEEREKAVNDYKTIIKDILDDFTNYGYFSE